MIDVSELMDDPDFTKCFTVKRPKVTLSPDGMASTAYTQFDIAGIVQPADPDDLASLPEGTRLDDMISVWSHEIIRGADGKSRESDVLIIDGKFYRVVKVENRLDNGYIRVFAEGYVP